MIYKVDGLELDLTWPDEVDPTAWRRQPDPDGEAAEDDDDLPASDYVKAILGFDPDELDDSSTKDFEAYQPHDDDPGVMIAIKVPDSIAEQLAVAGGNGPDQLHCTLAYLGRRSALDDAALDSVRVAISAAAAGHSPMAGKINGLGRFGASESSDDKEVVYATLDCPGLAELRTRIVDGLTAAGVAVARDHDFAPHITLSYVEPGEELDIPLPDYELTVAAVSLIYGDQEEIFTLGQKTYTCVYCGVHRYHLPGQHDQCDHSPTGECSEDSVADIQKTPFGKTAEAIGDRDLPDSEITVIKDYTDLPPSGGGADSYNQIINGALRKSIKLKGKLAADVKAFDSAINRFALPKPAQVYRGMAVDNKTLAKIIKTKEFGDRAFVSTSRSLDIARGMATDQGNLIDEQGFNFAVFKINLPRGFKAMPVELISEVPSEKEVILHRNVKFKVTSIKQVSRQEFNGVTVKYHEITVNAK